ncbi:DoxX family membrane protein [Hymenobacter gummosus]|uniref:DoxX family membrane protein n=1 Tax=Hymenobacter gummosus TaxID=1776032 RepID=A0A431U5P6_9BACT|nr:MauE/DoxX family redox-associated membrane protein [Hymenobacter gummosus]RTQ51685.1 DoxX family membrane protein [Hymenobacter gummosus]
MPASVSSPPPRRLPFGLLALAGLFVAAGVFHFLRPRPFVRIVPPLLPVPKALVYLSGAAEIGLGLLLLPRRTRRVAAWGLVALLLAVFPANVYMARLPGGGVGAPQWLLWARLPLQLPLMLWAWRYTRPGKQV